MTVPRGPARGLALATSWLLIAATLASCALPRAKPSPSASASSSPAHAVPGAEAAGQVARNFIGDWRSRSYDQMVQLVALADRARYSPAVITALLRRWDDLAGVTWLTATVGSPIASSAPPDDGSIGPVPAFEVPISLSFETNLFGSIAVRRMLTLTSDRDGWHARWRPSLLFPQLGGEASLALERTEAPRGRILAADGAVFAETRTDGMRVYPQEWLAGQTVGYVAPVTADELPHLPPRGAYQVGELLGRSGLEQGAEALLRGTPGLTLEAWTPGGAPVPILERPMVPGADLTITIRRSLQATAEAALTGHDDAATVVLNPRTGDVWALASAPRFNPNSMTLGTTLAGQPLTQATASARLNRAVLAAHPPGSSFKPFTLIAALESGAATPATRMSCLGTWRYGGFTYHNYQDHSLGGSVSLIQAMALSCNTTYMPLSIRVWQADRSALTDVVTAFGFGQSTGITHLADAPGVLPDAHYYVIHRRGGGRVIPYGPVDQIQLAIGQGNFRGTPLQLANAYAAFANGGTLWVPRLVTQATLPDGTVVEQNQPRAIRHIDLKPETIAYLRQALRAVVALPIGTAYAAFAGFGHQVAGKSGTAETGTPYPDAWFPAFAPVNDAEVVVVTVLVHVTVGTGGSRTAPLVRRVLAKYFADPHLL
jgi:cell division protein FtsI/penicillin-binding protein 2